MPIVEFFDGGDGVKALDLSSHDLAALVEDA
jgi:hypothetical protein